MPPPYRRNPLALSRAEVLDEPMPYEFFPPVGQGRNSFAPAAESGLAASSRLAMDALANQRDNEYTKREDNAFRRLELRDRTRILPYSTSATIAAERARAAQAAQDEQNSPFIGEERRAESQFQTGVAQAGIRALPETEELEGMERQAKMKALNDADPYFSRLSKLTKNDIGGASAYESFLRTAPPTLKGDRARQHAYDSAMKLVRDRTAVEAIDSADALSKSSALRDELLEDVEDPETGEVIGTRIKADADPAKVSNAVKSYRNAARIDKQSKAESDKLHIGVNHLDDMIGEYSKQVAAFEKDSAGLPETPEITSARNELRVLRKQRGALLRKMGILPEEDAPVTPPPVERKEQTEAEKKKSTFEAAQKMAFGK